MLEFNYSFIIPHKNSFLELERCLSSIPRRSDIQIIVVDDNSSDNIKKKLDKMKQKEDQNFFLLSYESTCGAGAARNYGLKVAKGRWLCFLDCDDFLNNGAISILDKYKSLDNIDIVFFQTNSVDSNSLEPIVSRGAKYNKWIGRSIKTGVIDERIRYNINPPWGKFFSKSFIDSESIKFDEVYAANDVMFSVKSGHYAKNIILDDFCLYCATDCANSIQKKTTLLYQESRFSVSLSNYIFLKRNNKLKFRMNIWKSIIRFYGLISMRKVYLKMKKAYQIMSLKHFILDFFPIPFLGLLYLIRVQTKK